MRIILLSVASIIIIAVCMFHPLYPTELGLFASGGLISLAALLMLWHELHNRARSNELLMLTMLFTVAITCCCAGFFDWFQLELFEVNGNASGFYSGGLIGMLLGIWISYRSLGRPELVAADGTRRYLSSKEFCLWAISTLVIIGTGIIGNQSSETFDSNLSVLAPPLLYICMTLLFCTAQKLTGISPLGRLVFRLLCIAAAFVLLLDVTPKTGEAVLWQLLGLLTIWLCYRFLQDHGWQSAGSFIVHCLLALPLSLLVCWFTDILIAESGIPSANLSTLLGWSMAVLVVVPQMIRCLRLVDWQQLRRRPAWLAMCQRPTMRGVARLSGASIQFGSIWLASMMLLMVSFAPMADMPAVHSFTLFGNIPGANRWLAALAMMDYHPFNHQVRFDLKSIAHAKDSYQVVRVLRPAPDRFSYTENSDEIEAGKNGSYQGMGMRYTLQQGNLYLADVIPGSPAEKAGLKRGDRLLKLNGHLLDSSGSNFDSLMQRTGHERFTVARGKSQHEVTVGHGQVSRQKPVYRFFEHAGEQIGYLRFDAFMPWIEPEISRFKKAAEQSGVQRIVIDLRANGGGKLRIAADMTSWLLGAENRGKPIMQYRYPMKYKRRNQTVVSSISTNYPGIKQVAFITTDNTCSASESLINAVKAYRPVTIVGEQTCGKPWFMDAMLVGGESFSIISGEVLNARDESEPLQGMRPDIRMAEDLSVAAGSDKDPLLRAAVAAVVR